jgi:ribosomal protein S18 acetylase RimI-like enzyme
MQKAAMSLVRKASPGDVPAIVECDAYAQSHASRRSFIQAAVAQGQCFVAAAGSSALGFVVLTHSFFEQGFIPLVVVAQGQRRMGLGLQLLAAAQSACGTAKLFTSTNSSNIAAQALLFKAGFVRSGIIENLDSQDPELVYFKWVR